MINLYFIDGISVNDEPTFDTLALQATFFDNHLVQLVDTGFYPPHYINKIKLSVEDFNLKKQVNYLSLDYNNKLYYYFIDSINYINEDIYELNVVMDTIQTYMFNIHCENALMERTSIARWNAQGKINRNYIRENIGEETFKGEEQPILNSLSGLSVHMALVGQQKSNWDWIITGGIDTEIVSNNTFHNNSFVAFIYLTEDDFNSANNKTESKNYTKIELFHKNTRLDKTYSIIYDYTDTQSVYYLKSVAIKMASEPTIYAIYKVPIEYLGINMITSSDKIIFRCDATANEYIYVGKSEGYYPNEVCFYLRQYKNNSIINNFTNNLDFRQNALTRTDFKPSYCPVLLDSNYVRISFGDMQVQSQYPLEFLQEPKIYGIANYDINSNTYRYQLSESNNLVYMNYGLIDIYDTAVFSTIATDISRLTDYYAEYDKSNKARALGYMGSLITSTIGGMPKTSESTSYDKVLRKKRIKGRLRSVSSRTQESITATTSNNMPGMVGNIINNTIDFATTELNKALEPNTLKYGSNSSQTYMYGMNQLHLKIFRKIGYEGIAKYFESVGYKVNEWYDNLKIFSNDSPISIRYYFNVIKTQDMNIDLHGCPSDNETIDNILQRFYDGIRLWRVDNEANLYGKMGQPTLYDNVERSFIE